MMLSSPSYHHALDSGVYLPGVDSCEPLGRTLVEHGPFGRAHGSAAFLILGQSNAANHGGARFAAAQAVYNFNPFDGLVYPASDPLLGATGEGGSPWCLMADAPIARGFAKEVLLIPVAVGGSEVADWMPGGPRYHRMMYALDRLEANGSAPTHVLWHQGEADALYGTSGEDYVARFRPVIASLRARGVAAPVYVAIAAYFGIPTGYAAKQAVITAAQRRVIDPSAGIVERPCTDLIRDRHDDCHMNEAGLRKHANAWVATLTARQSVLRWRPPWFRSRLDGDPTV